MHDVLFLMYGVSAHPLFAVIVAPLVPHRDYSEAHLLYHWTGHEPVYAQRSKFTLQS